MATSIAGLKVTTETPNKCALAECDEIGKLCCKKCKETPAIGTNGGSWLPDVVYCCREHFEKDIPAHQRMCEHRQWVRGVDHLGELCRALLHIDRERSETVIKKYTETQDSDGKPRLSLTLGRKSAQEPFCDPNVPGWIKNCAISFHHCVVSLLLSTGLMAYLSKGKCRFDWKQNHSFTSLDGYMRVEEHHTSIDPRVRVEVTIPGRNKVTNYECRHSMFLVTHPSISFQEGSVTHDGIILDPSGNQFDFKEISDTASSYRENKQSWEEGFSDCDLEDLGGRFKAHLEGLTNQTGWDLDLSLRTHASILAAVNGLNPELKRIGGMEGIAKMDTEEWKAFLEELRTLFAQHRQLIYKELEDHEEAAIEAGRSLSERQTAEKELLRGHEEYYYWLMEALIEES